MVARERRAELEIYRDARIANKNFLASARLIADLVFGENEVGTTTLRSPLVADAIITGTSEPISKIYDPENLSLRLSWRVAAGNKHDGSKFYKARQALENGVRDKLKQAKQTGDTRGVIVPSLRHQMSAASQYYETNPDSIIRAQFAGVNSLRIPLVHPGKVIFGLVLAPSDVADALVLEGRISEDALFRISRFVHAKPNPLPMLTIPFMRVEDTTTPEQHQEFIESIVKTSLFPLLVELEPVEIALRT